MVKPFIILGALFAFLAVAFGAFGAHGLRARLTPEMLGVFQTAVQYQFYHALALFAVAWLVSREALGAATSGWLFVGGILLFSGSLYALALFQLRWLGAVTPVGGLAFLAGWLWLAYTAWRAPL